MISLIDALERKIISLNQPVVTEYDVFQSALKIQQDEMFENIPLFDQRNSFSHHKFLTLLSRLKKLRVLKKDPDFKSGVFRVNEIANKAADEICCLVDPFCYLSHLSAMQRHGLTNRIPAYLFLTTPSDVLWKEKQNERHIDDYGNNYKKSVFLPIKQYGFKKQVRDMTVCKHKTNKPAQIQFIRNSFSKISSIGDTFVDMLKEPKLCGGMEHVIEVWQEHTPLYIDEVIESVSRCDMKIIKVRAGYIIDEVLNISDNRVNSWLLDVQRGGSRCLDPDKPYQTTFSDKWMISINA